MAYTLEQKAVFDYRVKQVKKALKKRKIKYYSPALAAVPEEMKNGITAVHLRNVMNAGLKNTRALLVLEHLAGIKSPELELTAV